MRCPTCTHNNKKLIVPTGDCVEAALDNIKSHYLYLKNAMNEKQTQMELLQQRNDKLARAVELLQRDQKKRDSEVSGDSPKRRRKTNSLDVEISAGVGEGNGEDISFNDNTTASTSDLNMALNSQQLLDSSALSPVGQRNESIAETEQVRSPRVLRTPRTRRELLQRSKTNIESKNLRQWSPISNSNGAEMKCDWLSKEDASAKKFLKPNAMTVNNERKMSLTLRKAGGAGKNSDKLRQTRLQLDVSRQPNSSGNNANFGEDVIDDSPNTNAMLKQSKTARSWLLRTGSSGANANVSRSIATTAQISHLDTDDDDVFEVPLTSNTTKCNTTNDFELDQSNLNIIGNLMQPPTEADDSESVIVLTPATQDIIFLDDTCDDNTHMESTELLQQLMKCGDDSLEHLKNIECASVKKIQKQQASHEQSMTDMNLKPKISKTKSLEQATTSNVKKYSLKVKQEQNTVEPLANDKENLDTNNSEELEEDEEFLVRPMIEVKKEPQQHVSIKNRKNIKSLYNIDCLDCQKYIDFLGNGLSDKEIEAHLNSCRLHNVHDGLLNQTPDDFWNPFIQTFAEDDPRNEVLIDIRFVDRTKRTK